MQKCEGAWCTCLTGWKVLERKLCCLRGGSGVHAVVLPARLAQVPGSWA